MRARKRVLIHPAVQFRFLALTGGIALAVIAVFYLSEIYSFSILDETIRASGLPPGHTLFARMEEHRDRLRFIVLMTTVFGALTTLSFGLGFSHRIVGPIYRLRKHIRRILAGEALGDVHFRNGDFFGELADSFNEYHRRYGDREAGREPAAGLRRRVRGSEPSNTRRGTPRSGSDG